MQQIRQMIASLILVAPFAANADQVYAPGNADTTEGDSNNCIPLTGCISVDRYQQIYDASLFSAFSGPISISAIAFRLDELSPSGSGFYSNLRLNISTTSASSDSVSFTFANNYGADLTTVFDGAYSFAATSGSSPNSFDVVFNFATDFVYDPQEGNLLFEWQNFGGDDTFSPFFDAATSDSLARVFALDNDASATDAVFWSPRYGLVTQFTATPVGPSDLLEVLETAVTNEGPGRSLADKIMLAQAYLSVPDEESACEMLGAFRNQVEAQRGKKLTEEQADQFTADAVTIADAIGCD